MLSIVRKSGRCTLVRTSELGYTLSELGSTFDSDCIVILRSLVITNEVYLHCFEHVPL